MSEVLPAKPSSRCHGRVKPFGVSRQRRADEARPERGQREREGRGMELPHQLEGGGRLGQSIRGEHDRDMRGNGEGE